MKVYTINDLAGMLKLRPVTIRRASARGDFPRPLPGFRLLRWSAQAVEEWMRSPGTAAPARRGCEQPRVVAEFLAERGKNEGANK